MYGVKVMTSRTSRTSSSDFNEEPLLGYVGQIVSKIHLNALNETYCRDRRHHEVKTNQQFDILKVENPA